MIIVALVALNLIVAFGILVWPCLDQDRLLEGLRAYYEERDQS